MADNPNILLHLMQEEWNQARHLESQRSTMTNFIIIIAAGIQGFLAEKGFKQESLPLTLVLFIIGVYGAIFSWKLAGIWKFHVDLALELRKRLSALYPDSQFEKISEEVGGRYRNRFLLWPGIPLWLLWVVLHSIFATLGLLYTGIILF